MQYANSTPNYWTAPTKAMVINIRMEAGVTSYDLPDKSILNNCSHWVGIAHRVPANDRKTRNGRNLINQAAFRAAHLRLRSELDDDYLRQIPLEVIALRDGADNNFFRLPGIPMDIANSKITISDAATIVAGEELELIIFYVPPKS